MSAVRSWSSPPPRRRDALGSIEEARSHFATVSTGGLSRTEHATLVGLLERVIDALREEMGDGVRAE